MTNPDWAVVLNTLYTSNEPSFKWDGDNVDEQNTLVQQVDIEDATAARVAAAVGSLQNSNLAEYDGEELTLTETGFNVAHSRELNQIRLDHEKRQIDRQQKTNASVVFLTIGLVTASAVDALIRGLNSDQNLPYYVSFVPILILIVIIVYLYINNYFRIEDIKY